MVEKMAEYIYIGEGFSKEKGRKIIPKEIPKRKRRILGIFAHAIAKWGGFIYNGRREQV